MSSSPTPVPIATEPEPEAETSDVNLTTASCPCCGSIIPLDVRPDASLECPTCHRVNDPSEVFNQ